MKVVKDMIDFVRIPENIMKFYDATERCFVFNIKKTNKTIKMYIPSIGVNAWIKSYVAQKLNTGEKYDEDFANYAPMLIADYRKLNAAAYDELAASSSHWGREEWSLISYVTKELIKGSAPMIKFKDEDGKEVEIPLSFQGGLRSIFLISDPLQSIC